MNGYNSSSDVSYSTCLPPEAYLRIIRNCGTDVVPKFKSSVYPSKVKNVTKIKKTTK